MFIKKSLCTRCIVFIISVACCTHASENYVPVGDITPMASSSSTSYLTIDPDDYSFLVYDCGTDNYIFDAMTTFGITPTYRDAANPVTADDLATHDILIVSWNSGLGDSSGLDPCTLYNGITGTVILTGHDLDYHTGYQDEHTQYAEAMFSQAIDYALTSSGGTGMIGLTDPTTTFNWVPSEWGITASSTSGETIESFTVEGLESGIYDGLDPCDMSNWGTSYHNTFSDWGDDFVVFELGGSNGDEAITIAIPNINSLTLDKEDGINEGDCVVTDDDINYYISYSNPITDANESGYLGDVENLVFVDYLSDWVDFDSIWFGSGTYDPNFHTVTWQVSKLSPGDSGYIYIKVKVNNQAQPLEYIINYVELSNDTIYSWASEETYVCCYSEKVIYVDASLNVPDPNGLSWRTAFKKLEEALAAARTCDEIWVADGTYQPTTDITNTEASFTLRKGIEIYGGFSGDEELLYERDWSSNKSILSGFIDSLDNDPNRVDYVVVDANNILTGIEGFTIEGGKEAGVYCENSSPIIQHNKITGNGRGIYCKGTAQPTILNNWIYQNDYGMYFVSPKKTAIASNNTISDNNLMGLRLINGKAPLVSNSIFTGHPIKKDIVGCYSTYSYLEYPPMQYDQQDPNIAIGIGEGNMDGDPNYPPFVTETDNYHLSSDSPCIDAGDPNGYYNNQRDIDNEFRVLGDSIDMGADEYCDQTENDADFNDDEIVNYIDFAEFGIAWLQGPSDPNWNDGLYDLDNDNTIIDTDDLLVLADEWLWMSCSKMQEFPSEQMMSMSMGMQTATQSVPEPTIEEQIDRLGNNLDWLNNLWATDEEVRETIDEEDWENFIERVQDWLNELKDDLTP